MRTSTGPCAIVAALLLAAAGYNTRDFPAVDAREPYARAVHRVTGSPNLQEISLQAGDRVMGGAFHLPAIIFQLSNGGGALVTTFPGAGLRTDIIRGFGVVSDIEVGDHDPDLSVLDAHALDRWVVREGEDRNAGPFRVAAQSPPVEHFLLLRHEGVLYVVDERLFALLERGA